MVARAGLGTLLKRSLAVGAASYLTANYITSFVVCTGPSMEPTLQTGNILITDQISPRLGRIEIGDVVIAKSPEDVHVCKRVAAKDGDLVIFKSQLYQIPPGHVWLLGDNTKDSNDSRSYGAVPMDQIRSRCWFRIWPDVNHAVLQHNPMPILSVPKYSLSDDNNKDSPVSSPAEQFVEMKPWLP